MTRDWDQFWIRTASGNSLFGRFAGFYRQRIIAPAVGYYLNRYFPPSGLFVECGSGTSQTTARTLKGQRKFIALDTSRHILTVTRFNPKIDHCLNGDIFSLPFKDSSLDGLWNVGVMEHFSQVDIDIILAEFRRVLKQGSNVVLFWPMAYAPYEILINGLEAFVHGVTRKADFQVYPDEISRLRSRRQSLEIMKRNRFRNPRIHFNQRDAFSFGVVVASK